MEPQSFDHVRTPNQVGLIVCWIPFDEVIEQVDDMLQAFPGSHYEILSVVVDYLQNPVQHVVVSLLEEYPAFQPIFIH